MHALQKKPLTAAGPGDKCAGNREAIGCHNDGRVLQCLNIMHETTES